MHFSGPEIFFFLMRTPDPQFSHERTPNDRDSPHPTPPPPIPTSELEASQSNLYITPNISFLESLLIIKKKHDKSS